MDSPDHLRMADGEGSVAGLRLTSDKGAWAAKPVGALYTLTIPHFKEFAIGNLWEKGTGKKVLAQAVLYL
jgi:hypothetical protein